MATSFLGGRGRWGGTEENAFIEQAFLGGSGLTQAGCVVQLISRPMREIGLMGPG